MFQYCRTIRLDQQIDRRFNVYRITRKILTQLVNQGAMIALCRGFSLCLTSTSVTSVSTAFEYNAVYDDVSVVAQAARNLQLNFIKKCFVHIRYASRFYCVWVMSSLIFSYFFVYKLQNRTLPSFSNKTNIRRIEIRISKSVNREDTEKLRS